MSAQFNELDEQNSFYLEKQIVSFGWRLEIGLYREYEFVSVGKLVFQNAIKSFICACKMCVFDDVMTCM